jgi:hypothetical protein
VEPNEPVLALVRQLRATTVALADHLPDAGPGDVEAALTRIHDLAAAALAGTAGRRLAHRPGSTRGRCPECGGPGAVVVLDGAIEVHASTAYWRPDPADDFFAGWRAGAPGRPDLGGGAPPDHEHSWPNPYTSCTCGAPPPDNPTHLRPDPRPIARYGVDPTAYDPPD